MNSIIELKKFYAYQSKLLHATQEFMGYDPLISLPLEMPLSPSSGEQIIKQNFVIGNEIFSSKLSSSLTGAQKAGCRKVEIYKNNKLIISIERGGHGYGTNYSKGKNFFIDEHTVYLLVRGTALTDFEKLLSYGEFNVDSYYLLVFNQILIPRTYSLRKIPAKDESDFSSSSLHIASRIKHWEGVIHTLPSPDDGVIYKIHAIYYVVLGVGKNVPAKNKIGGFTEFYIDGQYHLFENI